MSSNDKVPPVTVASGVPAAWAANDVRLSLTAEVAALYFRLRTLQAQTRIAAEQLASYDTNNVPVKPVLTYVGGNTFAVTELVLQSSAFADPQGAGTFAAMQWRVAEIDDQQREGSAEQRGIEQVGEELIEAEPQRGRGRELGVAAADPAACEERECDDENDAGGAHVREDIHPAHAAGNRQHREDLQHKSQRQVASQEERQKRNQVANHDA